MSQKTATLREWRSPATAYPLRRVGHAALKRRWYTPGIYYCYGQHDLDYFVAARRLPITTLTLDGDTWMVDDPPHWWAMEEHAEAFHGHVLCAGLGLGLMVHSLTPMDAVTRITVVERERDVIELVSPLVPHDKLRIIEDDFFRLGADALPPVNGVLFDLFVGDGRQLIGAGIQASMHCLEKWAGAAEDFVVRIHGLPNPMMQEIAEACASNRNRERANVPRLVALVASGALPRPRGARAAGPSERAIDPDSNI